MENNDSRRINYELHTAIDMIKLGIVLDKMKEMDIISKSEHRAFTIQAGGLLHILASINHRHFGEAHWSCIY